MALDTQSIHLWEKFCKMFDLTLSIEEAGIYYQKEAGGNN